MSSDNLQAGMEWSTYITSAIIVVVSVYVMAKVRSGSRFEYITMFLFGMILTNTFFILYMVSYNKRYELENSATATHGQLLGVVSLSLSADLIRYLAWQLTMWVFAFKYWVISIEMPKAIQNSRAMSILIKEDETKNEALENSESKYTVALWVGGVINCFAVCLYITFYGKLCMNQGSYLKYDVACYSFMNFCGLISSCFLGDALRRIYLTFKSYRGLLQNEKVMLLHLLVFLIYMISTMLRTF